MNRKTTRRLCIKSATLAALITVMIVGSPRFSTAAEKLPWLGGAGAQPCRKWLEERDQKASILAFSMASWVLGYVSGANSRDETHGISSNFTEDDVFTRIDFYCRDHPSDVLFQAAAVATADLFGTLASRIRKSLKKPSR